MRTSISNLIRRLLPKCALEQFPGGFVGGVWGDEFAGKGAGEEGGGELFDLGVGFLEAGFDGVGEGEEFKGSSVC